MKSKSTTLKDVAKIAGVSAMSVSKALNGKPGISDETRARIVRIAEDMHYTQNLVARNLRIESTMTLGVVMADSSEMVMTHVLRGVYDEAETQKYSVITTNTNRSIKAEKEAVETLIKKRIDGLIMIAPVGKSAEYFDWLSDFDIPLILLMRTSRSKRVDTVANDNYLGGYQVVSHLLEQGCRRFAFLPIAHSQSGDERIVGYKKALSEAGLRYEDCSIVKTRPFIRDGYDGTIRLLEKDKQFDALVCGCDTIAVGAMQALYEEKVPIPRRVCLIGYDGIELSRYLTVPLSTMVQPLYRIGALGTEILINRIRHPSAAVRKVTLESKLVARESTLRRAQSAQ